MSPFQEPVSILSVDRGKGRLLVVAADDLISWTMHISNGMRCRMGALEGAIVADLAAERLLAALILLRSHVEAAAMAAHCLEALTEAAGTGDVVRLQELIPRTLFGTGLRKHRDRDDMRGLLLMSEGTTIRITDAIASLDRFYYQDGESRELAVAYSLLCEFAHPNHRGTMEFMRAEERPTGWLVSYEPGELPNPDMTVDALETLLASMRGGYAASELLRCWRFDQKGDEVVWHPPSESDGKRVWHDLLQRPADEDTA